jgi:hypothetical protein
MKNLLLPAALLLSAATAAQAQQHPTIGLTVAYADSRLAGSNSAYTATNHSAYQAGLMADVYLTDVLSFHPEALYTLRYFDTTNNEDLNRDFSNLDVPLLARYHVGGLFFEAGPQVSFPLTAKNEDGANVKSEVNSVVLDYVLGLGYQLKGGLSAGLRFDGGATNLFKDTTPVLGPGKFKSNTFLFVVGYAFGNSRP